MQPDPGAAGVRPFRIRPAVTPDAATNPGSRPLSGGPPDERPEPADPPGGPALVASTVAPTDEALLELVRRRESAGLEALYDRYHRKALSVSLALLRDQRSAEDVVQDAFLDLWRRAATYEGERGTVGAWLLAIVHQRCVDRLRQGHVVHPPPALPAWEESSGAGAPAAVRAALGALPAAQRDTIHLAYVVGLSCQQIAERTGVEIGTVKERMRLALQQLRQLLQSDH